MDGWIGWVWCGPGLPEGEEGWRLVVPPPRLCTDNGVMVAWSAIEKLRAGYSDVVEGQDVLARWPLGGHVAAAPSSAN